MNCLGRGSLTSFLEFFLLVDVYIINISPRPLFFHSLRVNVITKRRFPMNSNITKLLSCSFLLFTPVLLDAKSKVKQDFEIVSDHPAIKAEYRKTTVVEDGSFVIILSDGSQW